MTSRITEIGHRYREVVVRVTHPVAHGVAVLQFVSGVIEDEAADTGDFVGLKRRDRIDEPVFVRARRRRR